MLGFLKPNVSNKALDFGLKVILGSPNKCALLVPWNVI